MTPQEIKASYALQERKFFEIRGEVYNLYKIIKIFDAIAKFSKKHDGIKFEDFFGWFQSSGLSLRIIVIDTIKLKQQCSQFIRKTIISFLSIETTNDLIKYSKINYGLSLLNEFSDKLMPWRKKKFAHFDHDDVMPVNYNLNNIMIALANISQSIDYIMHYLNNSHYLISKNWEMYTSITINENNISESSLDRYFENNDPVLKDFRDMINILNKNK